MDKDEAWNEYGLALGEYVAAIDADDLDRIAARVRDLDQAVRAFAQTAVDAFKADTLGKLEEIADQLGTGIGRTSHDEEVFAVTVRVNSDQTASPHFRYWIAQPGEREGEETTRAEVEALLAEREAKG